MAHDLDSLLSSAQYSLAGAEKEPFLLEGLNVLTSLHDKNCVPYHRILDAVYGGAAMADDLADVPYLPVSLFKKMELKSVSSDDVFKVMESSGTTSQIASRIVLDVETARLQTRALSNIVTHFLGQKRRPMVIIDCPGVIKDRKKFSARGAGILGMMNFGRDHFCALDDEFQIDTNGLRDWLAKQEEAEIFLFGFTFMVWEYFHKPLLNTGIDLSKATLFHSGGWKKLQEQAVSNEEFKACLQESLGIERVHNFYGMVEQVGSIFVECPSGYFHPSNFSDLIVRDPRTWNPVDNGESGVLEVLSLLPKSYPGHALLTEDLGIVHGEDDCRCGNQGKYFTISGRIPKAEIRGCSDTHVR